ncbi:hypothetical protein AAFC00_001329 [Neodothiora populina]|uniref:Uncharacterized protein n=1 Tax=Neodothiora populina TaxID=2781224 RepID=A0ABR3PNS2_9PEZI
MASLFTRAHMSCQPCPPILLQLPLSARQCPTLRPSRFADAIRASRASARLFHSTPIAASRKPRAATYKPSSSSSPATSPPNAQPRTTHPSKKLDYPLQVQQTSSTAAAAATTTTTAPDQRQLTPQQIAAGFLLRMSDSPTSTLQSTRSAALAANALPAPYYQREKTPYQAIIDKLAQSKTPTVIYTAPSQTTFVVVCLTSTLFISWVAYVTWNNYAPSIEQGNVTLAGVGIVNCLLWVAVASYFALGPSGLVKRVIAIPAKSSTHAVNAPKPTLRFEPAALPLIGWPKPFEVKLSDVHSDRLFAHEMSRLALKKNLNAGGLTEHFSWLAAVWSSYLKMFARVQRFAYVRAGFANLKLDLRDCQTLDNGRVLDQLIKLDSKPANLLKRMFVQN